MDEKKIKILPSGTIMLKAINLSKIVKSFFFQAIFFIFWLFGLFSIIAMIFHIFDNAFPGDSLYRFTHLGLAIFLVYFTLRMFYLSKIRYPNRYNLAKEIEKISKEAEPNIFYLFSFQLASVLSKFGNDIAKKSSKEVAEAILSSSDMNFILARMGVSGAIIKEFMAASQETVAANEIFLRALEIAKAEVHHQIEVGDVFVALCEKDKSLANMLSEFGLEVQDVANIVYWQTGVVREIIKDRKRYFDPDDLHLTGGIGRDWAYGIAPMLKQYSSDLTAQVSRYGINLDIIGHDREIKEIEEAFSRGQGGGVVLVGEPGVGKKTTVLGLVKKIYQGKSSFSLNNKHVVQIEMDALLSGTGGSGEITQRISQVFNEAARAGNIILFIENIENILFESGPGTVNASEMLVPYLESPDLLFLATSDIANYNKLIGTNATLTQKLNKVSIEEPTKDEMVRILEDVVPSIENHSNCLISYGAIKEAIKAADKYILNLPNPEKTINLLDGATAKAANERKETIVMPADIDGYVSEKYDIPGGEVNESEKEKLLNLEATMHERVIGQEEAINAIANAMRRSRAGVTDTKKPIGSFMFLGTTGVGKTETAKALAEAYFGDEERMIRFDMSEYQNKEDVYRLIGSNIAGRETPGVLTSAVREKPFSLLLFDEIEKANPDILNLFLQVLDEGHLTDGGGRKVAFTNTIIIATSNAGANLLGKAIESGIEYQKTREDLLRYIQENNIYKPEFLNRFTGIIVFSPLSRENILQIASLMIGKLAADMVRNKGVKVNVAPDGLVRLAELGFDPKMGARPMARVIEAKIEDLLAKKLLSGELKKGGAITITKQDIG